MAAALAAAALSLLLATPANAASAAWPSPGSLPACSDGAPAEAGGWDDRQILGDWTDDETWAFQIRPRTLTLGEVCVSSGDLAVPYQVNDLPTEGSYFEGGTEYGVCNANGPCMTIVDYGQSHDGSGAYGWCVEYSGTWDSQAGGFGIQIAGQGSTFWVFSDLSYTTYAPNTAECDALPAGQRGYLKFGPGPAYTITDARMYDPVAMHYDYMEATTLPSFWGATQGAPMTVGNGLNGDARIVCAASSSGSGSPNDWDNEGYTRINQDDLPTFEVGDDEFESPIWELTGSETTGVGVADCPYIVSLTIEVCWWDTDYERQCQSATWSGERYLDQPVYTDDPPDVAMCIQFPSNPNCLGITEPDIVCEILYSDPGNPITSIGEFFVGLGPWALCMIVPVGWDRGGEIEKAWSSGSVGQLADAFNAAIPGGIACGDVSSFDVPWGTVSIDTCDMDVAPSWVKVAVGGVIILGIAAIAVKRIMWAVGSKG